MTGRPGSIIDNDCHFSWQSNDIDFYWTGRRRIHAAMPKEKVGERWGYGEIDGGVGEVVVDEGGHQRCL